VSERELNAYVNVTLGPRLPRGLSDLLVRLEPETVTATALVDLQQIQAQVPQAASLGGLLSFFSGRVPLLARGRVRTAEDGFGTIEIQQVTLSSMPVPVSVVGQLVASSTRTAENPQGFDVQSPFRLPYELRRIRLEPGRAVLEY
jgi:hypothetical protein